MKKKAVLGFESLRSSPQKLLQDLAACHLKEAISSHLVGIDNESAVNQWLCGRGQFIPLALREVLIHKGFQGSPHRGSIEAVSILLHRVHQIQQWCRRINRRRPRQAWDKERKTQINGNYNLTVQAKLESWVLSLESESRVKSIVTCFRSVCKNNT